jgi:hypothetical protein
MIQNSDREATRFLCISFNRYFKEGRSLKISLMGMIDLSKKSLSQLRDIDSEKILAPFNAQMKVMMPSELRRMTIEIISYLIVEHINPRLDPVDKFEIGVFIDREIISLRDWSR